MAIGAELMMPGSGSASSGMAMSPEVRGMTPTLGPESRTILASPLADRLAGPLQHLQRQQAAGQAARALRTGMQLLARMVMEANPRGAMQLEKMAAQLLTLFPAEPQAPMTAGATQDLANRLPPGRGGPLPQFPPPPTGSPSLSGLLPPA